jgi:hypothetical protein
MKKNKVWRYYCDYCKKGSCSGGHMKKHESSCTMNPNRKCKMCDYGGLKQQPIADLINALGIGDDNGFKKLSNLTDGCPVCILSAINQSGLQKGQVYDKNGKCVDEGFYFKDFDFKKLRDEFLQEVNSQKEDYY